MRNLLLSLLLVSFGAWAGDEPMPSEPPPEPAPAAPEVASTPAMPAAELARAQFSSGIQNREPVDALTDYAMDTEPLYFFTEIRNGSGQTVTHRWMHDGETMAEVPFNVGGDRWRVWSSKNFVPEWTGNWTVQVVDDAGNVLGEESVTVNAAPAEPAMPAEPAEPAEPEQPPEQPVEQ